MYKEQFCFGNDLIENVIPSDYRILIINLIPEAILCHLSLLTVLRSLHLPRQVRFLHSLKKFEISFSIKNGIFTKNWK